MDTKIYTNFGLQLARVVLVCFIASSRRHLAVYLGFSPQHKYTDDNITSSKECVSILYCSLKFLVSSYLVQVQYTVSTVPVHTFKFLN